MGVHHPWLHNALAHRGGHTQVKDQDGHHIEEGRKQHRLPGLEHAGGHHGRNRVGGIMKPVHEIEQDREHHQQHHHPQSRLYGFHRQGPVADQEFSRMMPSITLATSSHLSVIVSRSS